MIRVTNRVRFNNFGTIYEYKKIPISHKAVNQLIKNEQGF
jgi:hypothetical protein